MTGLYADENKTSSLLFTPTQTGQTNIRAEIDYGDSILESDETNNVDQTTLEVQRFSEQQIYLMIAASIMVLLVVGLIIRRK